MNEQTVCRDRGSQAFVKARPEVASGPAVESGGVLSLPAKTPFALTLCGALLVASASTASAATPVAPNAIGFDVSFPQCSSALPSAPGFAVVGVNAGHAFSVNRCLDRELSWAMTSSSQAPAFYVNTQSPGPAFTTSWPTEQSSPRVCHGANSVACAYDYGWNAARVSFAAVVTAEDDTGSPIATAAARAASWWLDVETGNAWEVKAGYYGPTAAAYAADLASVEGMLGYLQSVDVASVGIYSTPTQWRAITRESGTTLSTVPVWMPGYATLADAELGCGAASFTGARVAMIQYPSQGYDGDYRCGLLNTPVTTSVSISDSATYTDQLVTTNNDGAVTYVQTTGSPSLLVSSSGMVTTSGALAAGSYTATGTTSDPNGDTGAFSLTLAVGVLLQSAPLSATVKVSGSAALNDQLVVTGADGAVTYVQTSGTPDVIVSSSGVVTTSGALAVGTYSASGTMSDPAGDTGTFTFSLKVGALVQRVPTTASVSATNSSTFTQQLNVGANLGAITYVQTSGTPALVVSSTGLVSTSGALVAGTYRAKGTVSDATGDTGTFTFALTVTPPPPAAPIATMVAGHAVAGRTVTLDIDGSGFYGRPSVTSHPGTRVVVERDTGEQLVVAVTVARHSRNGVFTFTITEPDGQSCQVRYNQR